MGNLRVLNQHYNTYVTGVVTNSEVGGLATGLGGFGLQVRSRLAQVVVVQLLNEG